MEGFIHNRSISDSDPPPDIVLEPNATATPGQILQINCVVETVSSFVNVSWLDKYGSIIQNEGRHTVLGNGTLIIKYVEICNCITLSLTFIHLTEMYF